MTITFKTGLKIGLWSWLLIRRDRDVPRLCEDDVPVRLSVESITEPRTSAACLAHYGTEKST